MTDQNASFPIRAVLGALMAFGLAGRAGAAPDGLAKLAGSWTVAHLRTDEDTSRKTALAPDDPSLVGRTLTIAPGAVTLQTLQGPQLCQGATLSVEPAALSRLLAGGGAAGGVKPSAYGLSFPDDAKVDALLLSCAQGGIGLGAGMGPSGTGGTWLLPLADGTLALNYVDGSLLILSRGSAIAPRASFDCARATSAPERAICGSADLASLDGSVASAFRADTSQFQGIGDPAAPGKLRASQRAWLRRRDACGSNQACLRRTMAERVHALGDTTAFTGE